MYRTILVPLDGSAFSERALPMATTLAQTMSARLVLVRAASASVFPGADPTEAQCQAVEEAQAYLWALATGLSEQGLSVEVAVPYGDAAESILLEIGLRGADLVVMCTHGRSGLGRWIYGSVAEQVLARSPAPVLLVHPTGEAATLGPEPKQAALLVTLDGSAFAETALPHAATLAHAFGGTILLLRTVEPSMLAYNYPIMGLVQESLAREHREAEAYLERSSPAPAQRRPLRADDRAGRLALGYHCLPRCSSGSQVDRHGDPWPHWRCTPAPRQCGSGGCPAQPSAHPAGSPH